MMLIIFLIIITLFILIGMVKVTVDFNLSEEEKFDCFFKILFFKIRLWPSNKKHTKKKKIRVKKIDNPIDNESNKKTNIKKEKKNKKSFIDILQNIGIYINPLPKFLKKLAKGMKIKKLSVVWCISTDDACETALKYAKCCGYFYNLFRIVNSICDVKVDKIRIFPDFLNEKSYCIVFVRLQISIGRLLIGILGYLTAIVIKSLNKNKKERLK